MPLDHLYGRPSSTWKRLQAILVTLVSLHVLKRYHNRDAPSPLIKKLNDKLLGFAPWQIVLATLTAGYTLSKLSLLTFMNGPEPFARYYSKNFYRATWIMTALDAGFWTAMKLRPKFLRDFFSLVFTLYYLVFADKAEEKVRRLRMTPTVELLRTSWEKQKHPLLTFLRRMDIPKITTFCKRLEIPRNTRAWGYDPDRPDTRITNVYLFYHGSPEQFAKADKLILQCPGGGFVCMDPICHEDYLTLWAKQHEGIPILSIDYKKAPEYPYPYAAEECFEIYKLIRETNGECIGLEGWWRDFEVEETINNQVQTRKIRKPKEPIKITLIGDSAGGNLAASTVVRIVENPTPIIAPSALILVYPLLNFDFACWIPPTQMRLLRTESLKAVNSLVDLHSSQYLNQVPQSPTTPTGFVVEDEDSESPSLKRKKSFFEIASNTLQTLRTQKPHSVFDDYGKSGIQNTFAPAPSIYDKNQDAIHVPPPSHHGRPSQQAHAPLALTSRMSYFSCRVLPPETMRALALLYLGPSQVGVNLHQNYHLSPVLARNEILEKFPKTYFLVGEKDPLVDDTVVFAGRLREAKKLAWKRRQMDNKFLGANLSNSPSDTDVAEVAILEGVSHAFMHLMMFLPEAKDSVKIVSGWFNSIFKNTQKDMIVGGRDENGVNGFGVDNELGMDRYASIDEYSNQSRSQQNGPKRQSSRKFSIGGTGEDINQTDESMGSVSSPRFKYGQGFLTPPPTQNLAVPVGSGSATSPEPQSDSQDRSRPNAINNNQNLNKRSMSPSISGSPMGTLSLLSRRNTSPKPSRPASPPRHGAESSDASSIKSRHPPLHPSHAKTTSEILSPGSQPSPSLSLDSDTDPSVTPKPDQYDDHTHLLTSRNNAQVDDKYLLARRNLSLSYGLLEQPPRSLVGSVAGRERTRTSSVGGANGVNGVEGGAEERGRKMNR